MHVYIYSTSFSILFVSLYSIGSIAMESNGAIQSSVTDLLEPFGVDANRIYINFFDMPRANVGWNRKTFAG
jgi:phenylpyruvate tautomerase